MSSQVLRVLENRAPRSVADRAVPHPNALAVRAGAPVSAPFVLPRTGVRPAQAFAVWPHWLNHDRMPVVDQRRLAFCGATLVRDAAGLLRRTVSGRVRRFQELGQYANDGAGMFFGDFVLAFDVGDAATAFCQHNSEDRRSRPMVRHHRAGEQQNRRFVALRSPYQELVTLAVAADYGALLERQSVPRQFAPCERVARQRAEIEPYAGQHHFFDKRGHAISSASTSTSRSATLVW